MEIIKNEEPTPAKIYPVVDSNWGKRTSRSAEAQAVGKEPIDRDDLLKSKVLNKDTNGNREVSFENGKVMQITPEEWNAIMSPERAR